MFILEGPDGGGKTTLARSLSVELSVPVHHAGGPPVDRTDLMGRIQDQFDRYGMILDRAAIISDRVYGPILRDGSFLDHDEWMRWIERYIDRGFITVYCCPYMLTPIQSGAKPHKSVDLMKEVTEQQSRIIGGYDRVFKDLFRLGMRILWYAWDLDYVQKPRSLDLLIMELTKGGR